MKKKDFPNLARTAAALDQYDQVNAEFDAKTPLVSTREVEDVWWPKLKAAEREVSEAFADDTADRNPRDNALLMGPTPKQSNPENDCTLRKWVRDWRRRQ